MDFHAHLSGYEVIGLLGGRFDPGQRALHIEEAYPCLRAEGSDSGEDPDRGGGGWAWAARDPVRELGRRQMPVGCCAPHPSLHAQPQTL